MPISRGPLRERHIAEALRALTNDHAREREPFDKRRAWQRIERDTARASTSVWDANRWRLSLAAVALTTLALAGHFYRKATLPLSYQASGIVISGGNLSTDGAIGELEFSDQSHISASPHSAFNVDVMGKHAALTRLVQGKLHVRVHHEPDTNWRFYAGRYEVQVVGTEFDLAWDDKTESLTLEMVSGEVRVLGAPGAARVVQGGGILRLPDDTPALAGGSTAMQPPASSARVGAVPVSTADAPLPVPASAVSGKLAAPHSNDSEPASDLAPLDWDALLRAGRFAAVVHGAETLGVDHAVATVSANDLKALAQAARYTGHAALSLRAWQALRTRFSSQPLGAQASFFLGRSYEEQGNASAALTWLGTYISEAPSGAYASEALGRRVLLLAKTSGKAAAASSARDYLRRFPGGAYEKTARAIVEAE